MPNSSKARLNILKIPSKKINFRSHESNKNSNKIVFGTWWNYSKFHMPNKGQNVLKQF